MSVMEFRKTAGDGEPVSGGAMDRVVVKKKIDPRILIAGAGGAALLLVLLFWLFAPRAGSQTVAADRLNIAAVQNGVFEDFLPLRARVTPLVTVYLDAVEGGRVEELAVEDGAEVTKGQLLAVLSNADLQLSTLARQTEVEQQLNNMRSQELALQQTRSANMRDLNQAETDLAKAQRQYDLYKPLAAKGFVTRSSSTTPPTTSTTSGRGFRSCGAASRRTRRCSPTSWPSCGPRPHRSTRAWRSHAAA